MLNRVAGPLALVLMFVATVAGAQSLISRYVAGNDYLVSDQPLSQPEDGKIHVVEFFLYSCPHCFHLEPELNDWRAGLGDDVEFSRVPVLFGAGGQVYARLYYAAEQLGVLDKVHEDIFHAVHEQGRRLLSEDDIRDFMEAHGVDGDRFVQAFESDAVTAKLREAGETMRAMHVTATPSLGIDGRYYISGRTAGSNTRMFTVADYLIDQERAK